MYIHLISTASVEPELWTVRRAYKQKVLETHPDKLPPDSTEEEKDVAREQFSKVRYFLLFVRS